MTLERQGKALEMILNSSNNAFTIRSSQEIDPKESYTACPAKAKTLSLFFSLIYKVF